ncbi:hypothetical protein GCM10010136_10800 [Limoniibacter endophyticus]|uniref:Uncharacterized protein n=1 Tax=Limoniibacter endophyticus TaxID=1565040 RepID=A0A8J3GHM1_9HYPH|nr:hypothetical protein GCM10010136_10800 [Limoniibacter endophyticus]
MFFTIYGGTVQEILKLLQAGKGGLFCYVADCVLKIEGERAFHFVEKDLEHS